MELRNEAVNGASIALVRSGRVLLIRRARDPFLGYWTLPGGRCGPREQLVETARRELHEELGLTASGLEDISVIEAAPGWRIAVFRTASFSGEVTPSDEVADWGWFGPEAASKLQTTPGLADVLALALPSQRRLP